MQLSLDFLFSFFRVCASLLLLFYPVNLMPPPGAVV